MLVDIPHSSIDDNALRTQILSASGHEATPASRGNSGRLMDIHDSTFHIMVDEVLVKLGCFCIICLNHLHRDSWAEDTGLRVDRPQFYAIKKAPSGMLKLDQRISNLENG